MNKDQFVELIQKYNENKCSDEEVELLESWYYVRAIDSKVSITEDSLLKNKDLIWASVQQENMADNVAIPKLERKFYKKIWLRGAAAAVLVLGLCIYQMYPIRTLVLDDNNGSYSVTELNGSSENEAVTLTLSNGLVMELDERKEGVRSGQDGITYIDGAYLSEEKESLSLKVASEVVLSTPLGQSYRTVLADGTEAWLNAGSTLTYPTHFDGVEQRRVKITGEVYFKVAKNVKKPFIVESQQMDIEVLGTAFNIQSYAGERISNVALEEGKIVAYVNQKRYDLTPGKQLSISNENGSVSMSNASISDMSSWRQGYYVFKATSLDDLKGFVKRWYKVDLVLSDKEAEKMTISGILYKEEDVEDFLNRLESTAKIKWNRRGNKIYIKY